MRVRHRLLGLLRQAVLVHGVGRPFNAAQRGAFRAWDRTGDGTLTETEMAVNAAHDFVIADEDRNGSLSPWEFAARFPILAILAKALG